MNCAVAPRFMETEQVSTYVPRLPRELLVYILKLRSKMMFRDRINKLQALLYFPPMHLYQWAYFFETYPFIGWGRDLPEFDIFEDDLDGEINSSDS